MLQKLNLGPMTWSLREATVEGQERCVEGLGQSDVDAVVGGQVVAHRPYPGEEVLVAVPHSREVREVLECRFGTCRGKLADSHEAPESLRDLDVQQVRYVQGLVIGGEAFGDPPTNP